MYRYESHGGRQSEDREPWKDILDQWPSLPSTTRASGGRKCSLRPGPLGIPSGGAQRLSAAVDPVSHEGILRRTGGDQLLGLWPPSARQADSVLSASLRRSGEQTRPL